MSRRLPVLSPPRLRPGIWAAILIVLVTLAGLTAWRRERHSSPPPVRRAAGPEPQERVFAGYAGSASCRDCHPEAFNQWITSHHGLAERRLDPKELTAAFQPTRHLQLGSQTTEVALREGRAIVNTPGWGGPPQDHQVDRAIGANPLVQFLVSAPGGRWQTLEICWDPRRQEWFDVFGNEDRQPGEWGHWTGRGMNWNSMCANCHNTRLRKNYDPAADRYQTAMAEGSVGCEACHGPQQAHLEWQRRYGHHGKKDPTLIKFTPRQMIDTCGGCHSRRAELTGDFRPGAEFWDHYDLETLDGTDHYFPDGQVHDEDYEYASFLSSRMHAAGVTCQDCHEPHSAKLRLPGNFLCLRCHNGGYPKAPVIDPVAHSHHRVRGYTLKGQLQETDLNRYRTQAFPETGGECVNCHMPQTPYMQRHWRHDHGFTIPDPLLTRQQQIPNACNRCHQDQTADWAVSHLEQWYGRHPATPRRVRAQTLAGARADDPTAKEGLLEVLRSDPNAYWKGVALELLAPWSDQPGVQTALLTNLLDPHPLLRTKAAHLLAAEVGTPAVSSALRTRLDDPIRSVRIAAAWALRATLDLNHPASQELAAFLDHNADQPAGQMQLGAFFAARQEWTQALPHYRQAVQWDTHSAPLRRELALIYAQLNQNAEALEELRAAVRLDPHDAEYRYQLALAWNEAGDLEAALGELEQAVHLNPRHARAWYNLGLARAARKDPLNALDALTRAENLAPTDPAMPYARATVLTQLGRPAEARAAADRALEIDPHFAPAREWLQLPNHGSPGP